MTMMIKILSTMMMMATMLMMMMTAIVGYDDDDCNRWWWWQWVGSPASETSSRFSGTTAFPGPTSLLTCKLITMRTMTWWWWWWGEGSKRKCVLLNTSLHTLYLREPSNWICTYFISRESQNRRTVGLTTPILFHKRSKHFSRDDIQML